jgi:proline racemase
MAEKLAWIRGHGEPLRRLLMLEPRGHAGMHGALLTEPVSPHAHAGVLSMHAAGFSAVSGEAVIAAVSIGLEHKLIASTDDELLIDTPAGAISVLTPAPVACITLTGIPCFVHAAGVSVRIGARRVTVDVAFGGEFYAIADSEAVGIPVEMANTSQLIRTGMELKQAVESSLHVVHPLDSRVKGIHGAIFTGAPRVAADLRSATVLDGQVMRRSPGAAGTAALLAVLDAMGLLTEGHPFTHEGVLGTTLRARVSRRQTSNDVPMIVPAIEGTASITGFHEFVG